MIGKKLKIETRLQMKSLLSATKIEYFVGCLNGEGRIF
jgi:hypothetical protein